MGTIYFARKAVDLSELKEFMQWAKVGNYKKHEYRIVKTIELDEPEYLAFTERLLGDYDFIIENSHLCGIDTAGIVNCIAVINIKAEDTILVNTEGYNYARYTSFLQGSQMGDND